MHKIIIFIILQSVLLHTYGKAADQESRIVQEYYRFRYDEGDRNLVDQLIDKVKPSLESMEVFFGRKPEKGITIILAKSVKRYRALAEVEIPEWSQAIAFTRQGRIVLNLSTAEAIQASPQILVHELLHIFLAAYYPEATIPVWLNEGLAQYFSTDKLTFEDKRLLATALSTGKLIDLSALDSVLTFGPAKAWLGYIEALSAVEYFIAAHGRDAIRIVLENLNDSAGIDEAFLKATGFDFIDFEIGWNAYLGDNYKWLVFLNFDNLLWVTIGLLFILALVAKRLHVRRTLRDWESDEAEKQAE